VPPPEVVGVVVTDGCVVAGGSVTGVVSTGGEVGGAVAGGVVSMLPP
jgi:hypothetical protein